MAAKTNGSAKKSEGLGPTILITLRSKEEKKAVDALGILLNCDRRTVLIRGVMSLVEKNGFKAEIFNALSGEATEGAL